MPPHVIFTRHADSPLRVIVPPAPVKYWDCRMTSRVPGRHVAAHGAVGGVEPMCQFIGADPRMGLDELQ